MGRPKNADRSQIAVETLTIRLSAEESRWLEALVEMKERDRSDDGDRVTKASFVRRLIRREARLGGLIHAQKK